MTSLPLALVSRWPNPEFVKKFPSRELALKAKMEAAYRINQELRHLESKMPQEVFTKAQRQHHKRIATKLRTREKWLDDIIKYGDFPAMLMAAQPDAEFMDRGLYRSMHDEIDQDVIVRGIASGTILDNQLERGLNCWFIETGYFGNYPGPNNPAGKKIWHRVVKNAMQHQNIASVPDDRYRELVAFDPALQYRGWQRQRGSKILLVVPSHKPCEYYGIDRDQWVAETVATIRKNTQRAIIVRDKATRRDRVQNSIYEVLRSDAWAVVTYNSIAAVEAIQLGVPAFALAATAADPVANKDLTRLDDPWMPDESVVYQWLCSLSYGQFSVEEIVSGRAWRLLKRYAG